MHFVSLKAQWFHDRCSTLVILLALHASTCSVWPGSYLNHMFSDAYITSVPRDSQVPVRGLRFLCGIWINISATEGSLLAFGCLAGKVFFRLQPGVLWNHRGLACEARGTQGQKVKRLPPSCPVSPPGKSRGQSPESVTDQASKLSKLSKITLRLTKAWTAEAKHGAVHRSASRWFNFLAFARQIAFFTTWGYARRSIKPASICVSVAQVASVFGEGTWLND